MYISVYLSTLLKEKLYGKKRRFQLRSLHTRHAFTCTPNTKRANNYALQILSGDLVLFSHDCCEFGVPVPLF